LDRMHEVCLGIAERMGFQLLELNGEADHVHLLAGRPSSVSGSMWSLRKSRPQGRGLCPRTAPLSMALSKL
jgi:REP element-mobilizing transposase RayT